MNTTSTTLGFSVEQKRCIGCKICVSDCPANIIEMAGANPRITPEKEDSCYECGHCLAICPKGAISILGRRPEDSLPLDGTQPLVDPLKMETLIKGRRSIRKYKDENLDPAVLSRLIDVAWHAPTAVNAKPVLFTVIDDKTKLAAFREEVISGLERVAATNGLPPDRAFFSSFVNLWREKQIDVLFRGAPHFIMASAPKTSMAPSVDCVIALSYFELFAQSMGVGTLWDGLATMAINSLVPELKTKLGIPGDHTAGYAMVFGKPAVTYARSVQAGPARVVRV